ncbi:MAG TPA: hypothetical protein PKD54_11195, partial [Pirellulaceae bacterium]|nr:hypothetical protein [Pirellulaceae bacterium]
ICQAQRVWETIKNRFLPPGKFWNVNLPDLSQTPNVVPALADCPLDPNPLPLDYSHESNASIYKGRYDLRPAIPNHDVALCLSGAITLTPC